MKKYLLVLLVFGATAAALKGRYYSVALTCEWTGRYPRCSTGRGEGWAAVWNGEASRRELLRECAK